jgi:hypothetical protein
VRGRGVPVAVAAALQRARSAISIQWQHGKYLQP